MKLSMIAAISANRVIGKNNNLPWNLPDDWEFFEKTTLSHTIIMGRKSFDALGSPLPKRTNIVVTRNEAFAPDGVTVVKTIDQAVDVGRRTEAARASAEGIAPELFVIGGGEIYKAALPMATRLYLTEVQRTYEGDTHFPEFDKAEWHEISRSHHPADDRHETAFDFVVYEK